MTFFTNRNGLGLKIAGTLLVLAGVLALAGWRPWAAAPAPERTPTRAPVDAYRGLGCWVSIYDKGVWADPESAIADMAGHGVRTLYVQTGNSNSKGVVYKQAQQERLIVAAHARGMKVVAWYLPEMVDPDRDFDRISAAIALRTGDGQAFDSFALDIESTKIRDLAERNAALEALTLRLRALVGASYPLGGIVPSPVGIAKDAGFWNDFPYDWVGRHYDVVLPMAYYTYHGKGAKAAAADVVESMRILHEQPGCASVPVHLIGGLASRTKAAEVGAFAQQSRDSGCIGASLYSWTGTGASEWQALQVWVR